jgi:NAD(P)-dependent dehydrogenase (short-subunit alcohol dehydrogenase family)
MAVILDGFLWGSVEATLFFVVTRSCAGPGRRPEPSVDCPRWTGGRRRAMIGAPGRRCGRAQETDRHPMAGAPDDQKTLILTGASRGIGHATVKRFSAAGWRVITISRQAFSRDCPWHAGEENHVQLDLSRSETIAAGIGDLKERLTDGRLDALVNNAGISPKLPDGGHMGLLDTTYETWLHVFHVNLFATALLGRGLFEELRRARGTILNVTSIAGSRVHPFAGPAYAASKAALAALTREMAHEFGPFGVRVNAIAPGEIDTAILSPGTAELVQHDIPLKRLGRPEEVAATIMFLCSPAASYINGAEIHINGGQHV